MALADAVRNRLARVRQQQERATLRDFGRKSALICFSSGPPDAGKTMTTMALAGHLWLPLFTGRLEVQPRLWRDSRKDACSVRSDRGDKVRFLDEFDAIGARRDDSNDLSRQALRAEQAGLGRTRSGLSSGTGAGQHRLRPPGPFAEKPVPLWRRSGRRPWRRLPSWPSPRKPRLLQSGARPANPEAAQPWGPRWT